MIIYISILDDLKLEETAEEENTNSSFVNINSGKEIGESGCSKYALFSSFNRF